MNPNPKPSKEFLSQFAEYLTADLSTPLITPAEAKKTLEKGYLCEGETVTDMYYRLSHNCEEYCGEYAPLAKKALFEMFVRGWLSPASPVAANFGGHKFDKKANKWKSKGAPASCYGVHVGNSITNIFKSLWHSAELSKKGGGLGVFFGEILGITSINRWMSEFDLTSQIVNQGGVRRGAFAFYFPIDHPDFDQVMAAKDPHSGGDPRFKIDSNIAVCISDAFMERLYSGDMEALSRLDKVLKMRLKTGSPYITFTGNADAQAPQYYKDHGMNIRHSQLCVLPHEKVLVREKNGKTDNIAIEELARRNEAGEAVTIFNGRKWEKTLSFKARGREEIFIEVTINNREKFVTTFDHKHILDGGVRVKAQDLRKGQRLLRHSKYNLQREAVITGVKIIGYNQIKDAQGNSLYSEPPMTYCPTIESTHAFALSNGLLTGNCNEIYQYSDQDHSYVCVLSSLNLAKYDEWKDVKLHGRSVVEWSIIFLDTVIDELIVRLSKPGAPKIDQYTNIDEYVAFWGLEGLKPALRSTIKGRALGLGTLGYHAYLMSKGVAFESAAARSLNRMIHKHIGEEAKAASKKLGQLLGPCEWSYDARNSQELAIAPTTTSSTLCGGGSAGVEPIPGNIYESVGAKVNVVRKNKYLEALLEEKGYNTPQIWKSISANAGSVQHLRGSILSDHEANVFKIFREIDMGEVIQQAADRQPYISQGQSLNLYYEPDVSEEKVVSDFFLAFSQGLKGLYYVRSRSKMAAKADKVNVHLQTRTDCIYCHKAKQLLDKYGIAYTEEYQPNGRVPQINYYGRALEGGYEELLSILEGSTKESKECLGCDG